MSGPLKVVLTPAALVLAPGGKATVQVTVQNASTVVQQYATSVVGLPDSAWSCTPAQVNLKPAATGSVVVQLTVPALLEGVYTLGVVVRSPVDSSVSRCEELRLEVLGQPALALEADRLVADGKAAGGFGLELANHGNTPLVVALAGSDAERALTYEFEPRGVELAPGETAAARLTVRAPRPWSGQVKPKRFTVKAVAGRDVAVEQQLTFNQKPRIAGGVLRVTGMTLGIGVLAAAILGGTIGAAVLTKEQVEQDRPTPAATTAAAPSTPAAAASTPAAAASTPAAASVPAPASGAAFAATPGASVVLDFAIRPDGKASTPGVIDGDLYQASTGVTLSTVVAGAPAGCADANALVLLPWSGGATLSSARPTGTGCNVLPVRMVLQAPAASVRLVFVAWTVQPTPTPAAQKNTYVMKVDLADGSTKEVKATVADTTPGTLNFDAAPGAAVVSLVFAHPGAGGVVPGTLIRKVTFVAA